MTSDKPSSPRRGRPPDPNRRSDKDRKADSREKQKKELGLIQVNVTVPASRAQDVRDYAARLRAEAKAARDHTED